MKGKIRKSKARSSKKAKENLKRDAREKSKTNNMHFKKIEEKRDMVCNRCLRVWRNQSREATCPCGSNLSKVIEI